MWHAAEPSSKTKLVKRPLETFAEATFCGWQRPEGHGGKLRYTAAAVHVLERWL